MNLSQHGIEASIDADGVLNLVTGHPLRVRLNGRLLNGGPASAPSGVPTQKYWQADGTQGDSTTDFRGELR